MILSEEIRERVMLTDLFNKLGIPFNKRGKNYRALCPFHNEKTPSFFISDYGTFYKCFGCGEGGDLYKFYMDYFKVDFKSAVNELAGMFGFSSGSHFDRLSVTRKSLPSIKSITENVYDCLSEDEKYLYDERCAVADEQMALREVRNARIRQNSEIFTEMAIYCMQHGWTVESWNYLTVKRGLSPEIITSSRLFFIKNYNQVNNHLKKIFSLGSLQNAGLFNRKDDGSGNLIFYKHRIIIPYIYRGEIVYLRGRYFDDTSTSLSVNGQKYLGLINDALGVNSPKRFYNADVIDTMFRGEHIYLTEGEFDSMVMQDLGYKSVGIAGSGNMPSVKWMKRLLQLKVFLMMDNDEAGDKLKDNLALFFGGHNKDVYRKVLPGKDVSEFAVMGA